MNVATKPAVTATRLASGIVGSPRISGDGSTVVWNQLVDDNLEIFRYRDGQVEQITHNPRADMQAAISADGNTIAWNRFSSEDPSDKNGHWNVVLWKDGVETEIATSTANEMDVALSRDGQVAAWSSDIDGKFQHWKVQTFENGSVQDISPAGDDSHLFPVIAGNGERIFWRGFTSDGSDLWMRDQTGTVKPITHSPEAEIKPAVTPDGKTLVFSSVSAEGDDDLYRLDLERATRPELISGEKKVDETWPTVAADGQTVVWTNFDRRKDYDTADTQIYLQDGEVSVALTEDTAMHSYPQISDDGKKIAFLWIHKDDLSDRAIVLLERPGAQPAP